MNMVKEYSIVKAYKSGNSIVITIPERIAKKVGVRSGDYLKVYMDENKVVYEAINSKG